MSNSLFIETIPQFVPNQVLTDTQLNKLRDYLDAQNRLTRTHLVGTGIICGLNLSVRRVDGIPAGDSVVADLDIETHTIKLTSGYGLTSDGYLISIPDSYYSRYRIYQATDDDEDGMIDYKPWQDAQYPIYELVNDQTPLPAGYLGRIEPPNEALTEEFYDCRVAVVFLEKAEQDLKSCMVTDCSNKGIQVAHTVRVLLVDEKDLAEQGEAPAVSPLDDLISIPRFHTKLPNGWTGISSTDDIRNVYGELTADLCELITAGKIEDLLNSTTDFLFVNENPSDIFQILKDKLPSKRDLDDSNQYHFGFIRDLAKAFNEFWISWSGLVQSCRPATEFSCHLMAGRLIASADTSGNTYRNSFEASPVHDASMQSWEYTRSLLIRFFALIEAFDHTTVDKYGEMIARLSEIIISPSQTGAYSLARTAVPFYYDNGLPGTPSATVFDNWQGVPPAVMEPLQGYYVQVNRQDSDPLREPFHFEINGNSLLRIEGHLGLEPIEVAQKLYSLRFSHNLDFDCLFLWLGPDDSDSINSLGIPQCGAMPFSDFVSQYIGMEHIAGVQPGGTLILVVDAQFGETGSATFDQPVVADFALPGRLISQLSFDAAQLDTPPVPPEVEEVELESEVELLSTSDGSAVTRSIPPSTRSASPKATVNPIAERKQTYVAAMYGLNESGNYSRNRSYLSALDFISSEDLKARELTIAFRDVNGKLMSVYKRAEGKAEKQAEYQQMIGITTCSYLDRLVAIAPAGIPTEAKDTLRKTFEKMSAAGMNLKELKKVWKASALKSTAGARVADQLNRMIK